MQRKKCFLIAVLLFLLTGFLASFQPTKASPNVSTSSTYPLRPAEWNRTYACVGSIYSLGQTDDKGYILSGAGEQGGCVVKTDSVGNLLWNRTYGRYVGVRVVQQTTDGGYMLVGTFPQTLFTGVWLCKTNGTGGMLWNKTYGKDNGGEIALSGQQTDDGGFVLAGGFYSDITNNYDFLLNKTDVVGNLEWSKTYGNETVDEIAKSVQQTSDGGYILSGFSSGGPNTSWLIKTDASGNVEWNRTYEADYFLTANSLLQTTDGGYVFVGLCTEGPYVTYGAYVAKTDANGEIQWCIRDFVPAGSLGAEAYSIAVTNDDGYIVAGDFWLLRINSTGGSLWNGTYAETGHVSAVIQTDDGGYVVAGRGLIKLLAYRSLFACFRYSPTKPIVNESIAFNASYSYDQKQDIVSYLWNFADGNITSIMNPIVVHRYGNPGIYNVSLVVVDAEGLNSTYSLVLCAKTPTLISLSTSTPSATAGYSVNISVTLLDFYCNRIGNETVNLYYTYSGFENVAVAIASGLTDTFGSLSVEWIPPAPSYFVIHAMYAGNYTHVESSKSATFSMLPYGEVYLFSVESNSTVSSMGFDTNSQTLSFTATGVGGTRGYAKVTAAKSLIPNLALLSVYVDGKEYSYNVTDANDSWVILFVYDHSVHLIEIRLDSTIPEFTYVLLASFMSATLFATMACRRKSARGEQKHEM